MSKRILSKITAVMLAAGLLISAGVSGAGAAVYTGEFEPSSAKGSEIVSKSGLPSSYNSKDLGYVTSVKDQQYNDCWAYSSLACYETKLLQSGFTAVDMSEDHLNIWATPHRNGTGWQRNYKTDGALIYLPLGYLMSWQGGVEQSAMLPIDHSMQYYGEDMPMNLANYGVTSAKYLSRTNTDEIKQAIMDNGAVMTSFSCINKFLSKDLTSYYMPPSDESNIVAHAIEVIGWDDDYPKSNFDAIDGETPQNNGAWLVKNSWGSFNSIGGYLWISYEDKYLYGDVFTRPYTISGVMEIDGNTKLLQNEIYGSIYEFRYIVGEETTYINRFDFDSEYPLLDKVVFETEALGAEYDLYYIPIENDSPSSDRTTWIKLSSGSVDYKGYICCDLEDFEVPDADGAVGITIKTDRINAGIDRKDEGYVYNSIGVGEWLVDENNNFLFINESQKGDSYVMYGDEVMDVLDLYSNYLEDTMGGTFAIKAITKKPESEVTLPGDVNMDGNFNVIDALTVLKYCADYVTLTPEQQIIADYNQDGRINSLDVTAMQRKLANIE